MHGAVREEESVRPAGGSMEGCRTLHLRPETLYIITCIRLAWQRYASVISSHMLT